MTSHIPIVDFSALSIVHEQKPAVNSDAVQQLAKEIYSAFSTVGFVYLKNHGISLDESSDTIDRVSQPQLFIQFSPLGDQDSLFKIDGVLGRIDAFFALNKDIKSNYKKSRGESPNGWDELERESTNINRPPDLKESFDIGSPESRELKWPDDVVPNFKSTIQAFYNKLHALGLRVLSAMAIGLNMDPNVFAYAFEHAGTDAGSTQLRFNYYPKITDDIVIKPGQIRCGEHTDYGAITLLIQDDAGGLEVSTVEGKFVPATPIKGTILVNIADLMQRWTSDQLKSTIHRVLIPEEEIKRGKHRRSLVFFFDPDYDAVITCLDGKDKYPPIQSGAYMKEILRKTYKF